MSIENEVRQNSAFCTSTDLINISATSETPLFLFKNPSGSLFHSRLTHFVVGTDSSSTRSIFKFYHSPTITADGTALTEVNTHIVASPPSASATTFKLPTISANGTFLFPYVMPADSGSKGLNRVIWLAADNTILVTVTNDVANTKSHVDAYWVETV